MASSIKSITPQFKRDIAALCAYEPRARALQLLEAGEIEAYLDWAMGEGYRAAFGEHNPYQGPWDRRQALFEGMPVDFALWSKRLDDIPYDKWSRPLAAAFEKIKLFGASAIEIALRLGTLESFESVLRAWSAPAVRFAYGPSSTANWAGWSSLKLLIIARPGLSGFEHQFREFKHSLLPLALLLGKTGQAEAMVRHGMCPHGDDGWVALWRGTRALGKLCEADLAAAVGAGGADVQKALDWIEGKGVLAQEWQSAFEGDGDGAAAEALFGHGALFDYYPLARASERGDAVLLRRLFDEGADPNCFYKTGDPMLYRLDATKMTADVLQAWLDAGARPILNAGESNPFTSVDSGSSAIYGFAVAGRADLVKQACERAAEPFGLTYKEGRKTCAPLLAAALDGGHQDLALWLISEKGCSLSHLDGEDRRPCSEHASGDLLAAAKAAQLRVDMRVGIRDPKTPPKNMGTRTDTI